MSGIVNAFLTDKELDLLVEWGEELNGRDHALSDTERHLLGKLRGMARSVSCRPCEGAEGETCSIPQTRAVTPKDVISRG